MRRMGRWVTKGSQSLSTAASVGGDQLSFAAQAEERSAKFKGVSSPHVTANATNASLSECGRLPSSDSVKDIAFVTGMKGAAYADVTTLSNTADVVVEADGLSAEQEETWRALTAEVLAASPMTAGNKTAPSAETLAALHTARENRQAFIDSLPSAQQAQLLKRVDTEKQQRKAMLKAAAKEAASSVKDESNTTADDSGLTAEQKEVMRQAFWLYQQDRQKQEGTKYVESTEWKRIRALGGTNPTLCHYLKQAGWKKSWPMPEPDGRAYRREQHAKAKAEKVK